MNNELTVCEENNVIIYDVDFEVNKQEEPVNNLKYKILTGLLIAGIIFFIYFVLNQPEAPKCSGII